MLVPIGNTVSYISPCADVYDSAKQIWQSARPSWRKEASSATCTAMEKMDLYSTIVVPMYTYTHVHICVVSGCSPFRSSYFRVHGALHGL